jgi:hypothetical protein
MTKNEAVAVQMVPTVAKVLSFFLSTKVGIVLTVAVVLAINIAAYGAASMWLGSILLDAMK